MKRISLFFIIALITAGCSTRAGKNNDVTTIIVAKNYPNKSINLQDVAEIEYVPLETSNDVLLGGRCNLSYISDKYMMIWERTGDIFIFHRNGKINSHFKRQGESSMEYFGLKNVVLDEKNDEVFVFDNYRIAKHRILVYSFKGEYKRSLDFDERFELNGCNFDDETLLVYDEKGLLDDSYNKNPYMLLSKKDGRIVSTLAITLPVRRPYSVNENNMYLMVYPNVIAINHGQNVVISDLSSDTIYMLSNNKELLPIVNFTPSVQSSSPVTALLTSFLTDNFIVVYQRVYDFSYYNQHGDILNMLLIHELESGLTSEVTFINNDFPTSTWRPNRLNITSKNVAANLTQAANLIEANKNNQLKGHFKDIVDKLDVEDNPVIMIVKFK